MSLWKAFQFDRNQLIPNRIFLSVLLHQLFVKKMETSSFGSKVSVSKYILKKSYIYIYIIFLQIYFNTLKYIWFFLRKIENKYYYKKKFLIEPFKIINLLNLIIRLSSRLSFLTENFLLKLLNILFIFLNIIWFKKWNILVHNQNN